MAAKVSSIDLVKGWISAYESGNTDYLREHTAEEMTVIGAGPQPMPWKEYSGEVDNLMKAFSDFRFNASNFKVVGDRVTCSVRITCTHTGVLDFPMMKIHGYQPTGKRVKLPLELNTYTVRNGKVSSLEIEKVEGGGIAGLLTQIGAMQTQPEKSRSRSK